MTSNLVRPYDYERVATLGEVVEKVWLDTGAWDITSDQTDEEKQGTKRVNADARGFQLLFRLRCAGYNVTIRS